jgi:hypothetical protein
MSLRNVDVVLRLSQANARRDWDSVYAAYASDIELEDTSELWGGWGSLEDTMASAARGGGGSRYSAT